VAGLVDESRWGLVLQPPIDMDASGILPTSMNIRIP
jgi:hypothetical protein